MKKNSKPVSKGSFFTLTLGPLWLVFQASTFLSKEGNCFCCLQTCSLSKRYTQGSQALDYSVVYAIIYNIKKLELNSTKHFLIATSSKI